MDAQLNPPSKRRHDSEPACPCSGYCASCNCSCYLKPAGLGRQRHNHESSFLVGSYGPRQRTPKTLLAFHLYTLRIIGENLATAELKTIHFARQQHSTSPVLQNSNEAQQGDQARSSSTRQPEGLRASHDNIYPNPRSYRSCTFVVWQYVHLGTPHSGHTLTAISMPGHPHAHYSGVRQVR
jgi:hypothetical protein